MMELDRRHERKRNNNDISRNNNDPCNDHQPPTDLHTARENSSEYQEEENIIRWINNNSNEETRKLLEFLTRENIGFTITHNNKSNHKDANHPQPKESNINTQRHPECNANLLEAQENSSQSGLSQSNSSQSESREQGSSEYEIESSSSLSIDSTYGDTPSQERDCVIATHNIRGITRTTDQALLLEEIYTKNIGILGLSETKLTVSNEAFAFQKNEHYKSFSSASPTKPYGGGVLLLIRKDIEKYIESVEKIPGHMIAVNVLSRRRKTFICQIYLPCLKKESALIQEKIKQVLKNKRKENFAIILMGDFNAVVDPSKDRSRNDQSFTPSTNPEINLFEYLIDNNYLDAQEIWEEEGTTHTWKNSISSSRIDYIWASRDILLESVKFQNKNSQTISESDHTILALTIPLRTLILKEREGPEQLRSNSHRIKSIVLEETQEKQWEEFKQKIDKKLKEMKMKQQITDTHKILETDPEGNLERRIQDLWTTFEGLIVRMAFNHLSCRTQPKRSSPKNIIHKKRQETYSPHYSNYFRACTIRKKWKAIDTRQDNKVEEEMWKEVEWLQEKTGLINTIPKDTHRHQKNIKQEEREKIKKQIGAAVKMLKGLSYREEQRKKNEEIKKALQKRCADLKTNQRRVIQALTNTFKDKIKIDRIKVQKAEQDSFITTNREDLFQQIRKYYQEAFKERDANFNDLDESWKKQYAPKEHIQEDWYKPLEARITIEELTLTIKSLPNNKAAGPSGIKYEMLKNLGEEGSTVLLELFNLFLNKGRTPESWKESLLYPISKGKEWKCELRNTRPIVLLEVTRKCFTKIITERLAGICKERNILQGPNFAGLPGESTMEPIHLLNNICEEAREEGKELWILFQDTAKAYDTISLEMLEKAVQRIKIPEKIANLILEPFRKRRLKIITSLGLTGPITAGDGIDQGETISPLLWRIFYDPLLCKIQENPNFGYTMECEWTNDLSKQSRETQKLKTRHAAIAYMDDTTWIARSEEDMSRILQEAKSFYEANDSQINGEKSVLITINKPDPSPAIVRVGPKEEIVIELDRKQHARFLGIWIGSKSHTQDAAKRAAEEIAVIYKALNNKWVTDKQIEYVINRVLVPRIEYRIQHSLLTWNTCNNLTKHIRRIVRTKATIASTLPNSVVHHKGFYNTQKIWNTLKESQISNLIARLNSHGPSGLSTWIRLKQAQILNWEPKNIIIEYLPKDFSTRGNLSSTTLKLANSLGISLRSPRWSEAFSWKGGLISIKTAMGNNQSYKKAIPSLQRHKIMFVDQILNKETNRIMEWNFIQLVSGKNKGPKPHWYKTILEKLTNEGNKLKSQWENLPWLDQERKFFSLSQEADGRKSSWYIKADKENPHNFVWIRKKGTGNNKKRGYNTKQEQHYVLCQDPRTGYALLQRCNQNSNVEHMEDENLSKAECCKLTEKRDTQTFYFDLLNHTNSWRKKTTLEIPVDCRYLEEEIRDQLCKNIKFAQTQITESFMEVEIQDVGKETIEDNIESGIYQDILLEEYKKNCQENTSSKYQFYTDGSLGRTTDQEKKMGIAWIQTKGPNIGSSFAASTTDWPSAYKAELTAIVVAALTLPLASEAEFVTDSASCISAFNKLTKPNPRRTMRRWIKEKNWSLWMRFIEIIRKKKLKINLKKVKAHSGHKQNDMVDKLAKEGREAPEVVWKDPRRPLWTVLPVWNSLAIDMSIREFIKEVHKKETLVDWTQQNRIQERWSKEIEEQERFDWKAVWKQSRQGSSLQTSFKQAKIRSFRTKLMNDELPTFDNLIKRRPDLYSRKECLICNREEENTEHLFACTGSIENRALVWEKAQERMKKKLKEIQERKPANQDRVKEKITGDNMLKLTKQWENICSNSGKEQINMCLGLLETSKKQEWSRAAKKDGLKTSESGEILDSLSDSLLRLSRKKIWIPRCEEVIAWEKMQEIVNKNKKRKGKYKEKKMVGRKSRGRPKKEEVQVQTKTGEPRKSGLSGLKKKVVEVTWKWIKEGKKWLGY